MNPTNGWRERAWNVIARIEEQQPTKAAARSGPTPDRTDSIFRRAQMTRNFPRIFFLVAIVAASSLPLLAQQFATLNVIVTDPSGKLVPNARVALKSTDTGVTRSQIADRAGLAVLTALTAGDYALKV